MMSRSCLADLSLDFGVEIVYLSIYLTKRRQYILSSQICKSGTSIGANISEAQYAHSKADFIAKMQIALKEANETCYWLILLRRTNFLSEESYQRMYATCNELRMMLISSIRTAKNNTKQTTLAPE